MSTEWSGVTLQYANPALAQGVPEGCVSTGFVSLGATGTIPESRTIVTPQYLLSSFAGGAARRKIKS